MDKNELLVKIAAILACLLDTGGSPESTLYIYCGMDMAVWEKMRYILTQAGFVTIKGNFVKLTADGKLKAEQINKIIATKA